jgi:hypothetical protein
VASFLLLEAIAEGDHQDEGDEAALATAILTPEEAASPAANTQNMKTSSFLKAVL